MTHQHLKKLKLKIGGMHCANCEVLIERQFRKIPGIKEVHANHGSGKVRIVYSGEIDSGTLQNAIAEDGYTILSLKQQEYTATDDAVDHQDTTKFEYLETGAALLVLAGLYFFLREFNLLPRGFAISDNMGYAVVLVIGLVASISSCIAVTGGLLIAVAAKYNEANSQLTAFQRLKPHLYFNAGRIISYTVLGGMVGLLGSALTLSPGANGALTIAASIIMIVLGLQMLKVFPSLGRFQPKMPKFLAHKIHDLATKEAKGGAFVLGASTFFLPCGFTQALQLYVLSKGSFMTGALTMLVFSLGTLPALLSLSAISSFAKGNFQRYFLKLAGAAVIFLGFINIQSGLTLSAVDSTNSVSSVSDATSTGPAPQVRQPSEQLAANVGGKQIVNMRVNGYDYEPHQFAVTAGVPVEWRIDGREAAGCGRLLIAPKMGVRKILSHDDTTVISFTPQEPGTYYFNCGMGMMTSDSKFVVSANAQVAATAPVPAPSPALTVPADVRAAIEGVIKEYVLQHPEVLQEALAELEKREKAAEAESHQAAIKENAATIFSSPRQVVLGNPQGDVTMVEFFDYNCGYCKRALSDMVALLKSDPKLRVVLKEFPVLGDGSTEAATVAIAVRMQDESGKKYLEFHQRLLGGRGQADRAHALAVAREVGVDMDRLEHDMTSPEVKATISENLRVAQAIGVAGTPTYVVGKEVVVGAIGLDGLKEKISAARR